MADPLSTSLFATDPRLWVPIRSLGPGQRRAATRHLLGLPQSDRYLRFGFSASDEQIERYIEGLNFERDEVFGIFNRRLRLLALAHLAYPDSNQAPAPAEFGVSVLPSARGRGYGSQLFGHAMLHARNRNIDTLFIHALSENSAMLHIASRFGATLQRDGAETDAFLKLPPDTLASQVEALVTDGLGELDYRYKQQSHLLSRLLDISAVAPPGH